MLQILIFSMVVGLQVQLSERADRLYRKKVTKSDSRLLVLLLSLLQAGYQRNLLFMLLGQGWVREMKIIN
jgi:enterochelin esterase-like enzyme